MYSASLVRGEGLSLASSHFARTHLSMRAEPESLASVAVSWASPEEMLRAARTPIASVRMRPPSKSIGSTGGRQGKLRLNYVTSPAYRAIVHRQRAERGIHDPGYPRASD